MSLFISILFGTSAICFLLFGRFRYLDARQSDDEIETTKYSYYLRWRKLDGWSIMTLPKKAMVWFLGIENFHVKIVDLLYLSSNGLGNYKKINLGIRLFILAVSIMLLALSIGQLQGTNYTDSQSNTLVFIITLTFLILVFYQSFYFLPKLNLFIKDVPIMYWYSLINFSILISFIISFAFFFLSGWNYSGDKNSTFRIFLVNGFLDFLTISITIQLLKLAHKSHRILVHLLLIFIDLVFAAIFAGLALYFICWYTEETVSFSEIINSVFGMPYDGSRWEITKWFWLIHTTFIPTFIYMTVLVFLIFGKMVVLPYSKMVGEASVLDRPHWLTATFFGMIGFGITVVASFLAWVT